MNASVRFSCLCVLFMVPLGPMLPLMDTSPAGIGAGNLDLPCPCLFLMVPLFLLQVSGLVILALGVWMKLELYMYMELTTFYYNNAPYILIGVGATIVVVGLLGCFCTIKAYKAPLIMVSRFTRGHSKNSIYGKDCFSI